MKLTSSLLISLFFVLVNICNSQNKDCYEEINNQVWNKFTKAFETLDVNLFESIHSDSLIRVSGNSKKIRDKNLYLEGYKKQWSDNSINQTISFRFLERICNNNTASERGIYKLARNPNTKDEKSYYGKFHVYLKKESNLWKILIDYDSTENNTIKESSYNNAYAIDDFEKY